MNNTTDLKRNNAAEEGMNNDPQLRDEDAAQPGASTISSSKNDEANQHLTKTNTDGGHPDSDSDEKADKKFDD